MTNPTRELLCKAKADIREVNTAEAERLLSEGWALLDVRERNEYERGVIPGSLHIPRGLLEFDIERHIRNRDRPIMTMCASGARSALATVTLMRLGYTRVVSVDGGFNKWKAEGRHWEKPGVSTKDQRDRVSSYSGTSVEGHVGVLTMDQRDRYARHLVMSEIGEEGQNKLLNAKVLLLGVGGLGSPVALYLAAAGVGTLGVVDMDSVDPSNLQRQVLHNRHRVGERKVDSARKTIAALNPDVKVVTYDTRLRSENVAEIVSDYDVLVDGSDNFESRYLLDDASVRFGIPVVHGSIFRFEGQVTVFDPRKDGVTFKDMVPEVPPADHVPNCSQEGVLGVLPGIVGGLQALETLKLILDIGDSLVGRLMVFDALETSFTELELRAGSSRSTLGK